MHLRQGDYVPDPRIVLHLSVYPHDPDDEGIDVRRADRLGTRSSDMDARQASDDAIDEENAGRVARLSQS
jgi:hypothetical protein